MGLSEHDRALLDVAGRHYRAPGAMEQAMVAATGMSVWRCWQRFNQLLDEQAALEHAPTTVYRWRRLRDARRRRGSRAA